MIRETGGGHTLVVVSAISRLNLGPGCSARAPRLSQVGHPHMTNEASVYQPPRKIAGVVWNPLMEV